MRNKESVYASVAIAAIGITGLTATAEGKRHTEKRHTAIEKRHTAVEQAPYRDQASHGDHGQASHQAAYQAPHLAAIEFAWRPLPGRSTSALALFVLPGRGRF